MKTTVNADINNLFNKFGGDAGNYQEIQQDYAVEKAQQSWPLINAIEKAQVTAPKLEVTAPALNTPQVTQTSQPKATENYPNQISKAAPVPQQDSVLMAALTAKPAQVVSTPAYDTLNSLLIAKAPPSVQPESAPQGLFTEKRNQTVTPPRSDTLNSLFGKLKDKSSVQSSYVKGNGNDPLNRVFLRVLSAQKPAVEGDKDLQNLFGYVNK